VSRLLRFHDGDTFQCNVAGLPGIIGKAIEIRCQHYDAPEINDHRPAVLKLAQLGRAFVQKQLQSAGVVTLANLKRDKYFRLLADVLVDGQPLAGMMLAARLAHPYEGGTKDEDWTDCLKANGLI
jgi:endonuclease YncB( thermonuclease family)